MGKSTKFKKGDFAIQFNSPADNCFVKILEVGPGGGIWHEHLDSPYKDTGMVNVKYLRRATKKEILIHAVRKEY